MRFCKLISGGCRISSGCRGEGTTLRCSRVVSTMYSYIQHLIAAIYLQCDIQAFVTKVFASLLTGACDIISLLYLLNSYSFELYISAIETIHVG